MPEERFRTFVYLIASQVCALIVEHQHMSEIEAISAFYHSDTYRLLEIENSKFWWMSADQLYEDYLIYGKGEVHHVQPK